MHHESLWQLGTDDGSTAGWHDGGNDEFADGLYEPTSTDGTNADDAAAAQHDVARHDATGIVSLMPYSGARPN